MAYTLRSASHRRADALSRLQRCHTINCRTLPDRIALLEELGIGGRVAEIGVAFGDFSRLIWDVCRPVRFHLIDAWDGARYRGGRLRVEAMFAGPIRAGRVLIHHGRSTDRLAALADASLDWVYVDTDHSYDLTHRELLLAAQKVGPGGRIAGHDFCTGSVRSGLAYGVIPACHDFCVEEGFGFEFLTLEQSGHFSFCLKRLEDF